jgi:hypothetical protein
MASLRPAGRGSIETPAAVTRRLAEDRRERREDGRAGLVGILPPHAIEFFVVPRLVHEVTRVLIALGPVLLALNLGLEL